MFKGKGDDSCRSVLRTLKSYMPAGDPAGMVTFKSDVLWKIQDPGKSIQ